MVDNGVILHWFLAWMRDRFRGILLYFLHKIDNTRYIPELTQTIVPDLPEETPEVQAEDEFQVHEVDNVDDSFISESNIELIDEPIDEDNYPPEPSTTNAHFQELVGHNALLIQRQSSLMELLSNTTDGSYRLIMTPGADSILFRIVKPSMKFISVQCGALIRTRKV